MSESGGGRRGGRIDEEAKRRFLEAAARGARLEDAAASAGASLAGFYGARARDAAFRQAWARALEESAKTERAPVCPSCGARLDSAVAIIAPNNKRRLQRRRMRHVKFTDERRRAFLDHFACSCDADAAAEAAGVDRSTVYKRRLRDPDFAREWSETLGIGYVRLEAEAVRQRLEAQRRLKEGELGDGEIAQEFERVMKLLARWDRRGAGPGARAQAPDGGSWTFEQAIEALETRLKALGIPIRDCDSGEGGEE